MNDSKKLYQEEVNAFRRLQAENKYLKQLLREIYNVDTDFIHKDVELMKAIARKGID